MMSANLSNIATLNIKDPDYYCIISLVSEIEAINLKIWSKKVEHYKTKNLFSYMKMVMAKKILSFGNIEIKKKYISPS